jgi:hypothetical protein
MQLFVFLDMSTLNDIKQEIDRLSGERLEVLAKLSEGKNAELAEKHQQLEERIAELWELQRTVRARIRFGDRNEIIQRARHDERLSRAA